jgi:hypothetical protein
MKKISFLALVLCTPANFSVFSKENSSKGQGTFASQIEPGNTITKQQTARIAARVGFPKKVVPIITCLAEHESHFIVDAVNKNQNSTSDFGLFQINSVWLQKNGCDTTAEKLLDPVHNAECALKVYKTQGLNAWSTYKTFKQSCLAYRVHGLTEQDLIADAKYTNKKNGSYL